MNAWFHTKKPQGLSMTPQGTGIPDIGLIWPGICVCCLGPVPAEGNRSPRKDPAQGGTLCHQ